MRAIAAVTAITMCTTLVAASSLQPPEPPAANAGLPSRFQPIPAELVLEDIRDAYSGAPWAESVRVRFRSDEGASREDTITVRCQPAGPGRFPTILALELGALRVWIGPDPAGATELLVTSVQAPGLVFRRTIAADESPATVLAGTFPPIPLAQLAFAGVPGLETTPYTPSVQWNEALAEADAAPPRMALAGTAPGRAGQTASIMAVAEVETGRLTWIQAKLPTVSLDGNNRSAELNLWFRPAAVGDPLTWRPDIAGAEVVPTITELRPRTPNGEDRQRPPS